MPETIIPAKEGWKCNRCNYIWPKKKNKDGTWLVPELCARCHNPFWNKPRLT